MQVEKMNRIGRITSSCISKLSWFAETLAEVALFGLALMVVRSVIFRYLFKTPDYFAVEIGEYLLLFICFMSIAWVLKENRHVTMEAITTRLTERARLLVGIVTSLLALGFCSVVVWKATEVMLINYERGFRSASLVSCPQWILFLIIAFGSLTLAFQFLVQIGERGQALRRPKTGQG